MRPVFSINSGITMIALVVCLGSGLFAYPCMGEPATAGATLEASSATAAISKPATQLLSEDEVIKMITAKLQQDYVKDGGELELQLTQPWEAPTVPNDPLTLKILELPSVGVTPTFIIRFQLCDPEKNLGVWQTSVRAHIWRQVWVANTDLRRGTLLADADVRNDRRDILMMHESLADIVPNDSSSELAESVPSGTILLERMLRPRTLIRCGQIANAIVEAGGVSITTKVEALEDGAAGQIIHIRNISSRRDLTGKVVSDQTISVNL